MTTILDTLALGVLLTWLALVGGCLLYLPITWALRRWKARDEAQARRLLAHAERFEARRCIRSIDEEEV